MADTFVSALVLSGVMHRFSSVAHKCIYPSLLQCIVAFEDASVLHFLYEHRKKDCDQYSHIKE